MSALVIHSYDPTHPWSQAVMDGIYSVLNVSRRNLRLSVEYLRSNLEPASRIRTTYQELFATRYSKNDFDVVLVSDDAALEFVIDIREQLFPDTPVVFCGVNASEKFFTLPRNIFTGVFEDTDFSRSLRIIRDLHSDATRMVYVHVGHTTGKLFERKLSQCFDEFESEIEFLGILGAGAPGNVERSREVARSAGADLFFSQFGWSPKDFRDAVKPLTKNDVLLVLTPYLAWNPRWYRAYHLPPSAFSETERTMSELSGSGVPIYGFFDHYRLCGALATMEVSGESQGIHAAKMVSRILAGERPETIEVIRSAPTAATFVSSKLKEFGIKRVRLPYNAEVVDDSDQDSVAKLYGDTIKLGGAIGLLLIGVIGVLSLNIWRRIQAQKELERFREAIDHSADIVVLSDLGGKIEFVNSTGRKLLGAIGLSVVGEQLTVFRGKQIKRPTLHEILWEVIRDGSWLGRFEIERDGESKLIFSVVVSSVCDSVNNEPLSFVAVLRDQTEDEGLQQRVQQLEKSRALGLLSSGIAHDFNNILGCLVGNLDLAKLADRAQTPLGDYLHEMTTSCQRAERLVSQIMAVSRQGNKDLEVVDICHDVSETIDLLRKVVPKEVGVTLLCCEEECPVQVDRSRFQQIVMNLCSNAVQATSGTNGLVEVFVERKTLDRQSARSLDLAIGDYGCLTVSDNGVGMSALTKARIFEPYFTTKSSGEGNGLGLATTLGSVKEMNGVIEVQSEVGKGSCFCVYLPVCDGLGVTKAQNEHPGHDKIPFNGSGITVLLVDDEPQILESQRKILETLQFEVHFVSDGVQAWETFLNLEGQIDLVVTDLSMPRMRGDEFAFRVRARGSRIPIVFMTGLCRPEDLRRLSRLDDIELLFKPFNTEQLENCLRRLFEPENSVDSSR